MTRVLLRCDASLSIGSGHVIRCRTLARILRQRGAEVIFLCRRQPGDLVALLEKEFRVLALPEQPLSLCDGLAGRELYKSWIGCSQPQDSADCLTALSAAGVQSADWLVVDHYGLDVIWQSQILNSLNRDGPCRLLVIDDLADRLHRADLLLDQNFFGIETNHRYHQFLPAHCRQLLGPHYALLGPEYAQLQPLVPIRTELRRVLVFFGGVDPDNLTCRALEALTEDEFKHLAVDVVLGQQSLHRKCVEDLVSRRQFTTLHSALPSLAGLMARADLAIGAGGSTTWERACLKLPSLVVTIAANQQLFTEALSNAGHVQLLGDASTVNSEQIRLALSARLNDPMRSHHACGGHLTDGLGALRVSHAMLGIADPITLRPADVSDEALLIRWANNPMVRAKSSSLAPIATSDHPNTLSKWLTDPDRLLLIATSSDCCPVGMICFERQSDCGDCVVGDVVADFSVDECVRGTSLEDDLIRLGLQAVEQRWGANVLPVTDPSRINESGCFCFSSSGSIQEVRSLTPRGISTSQPLALSPSRITLLSDRASWLNSYLPDLIQTFWIRGHAVRWIHTPAQLVKGDVCFLLSCGRLLSADQLALSSHNLVVHESNLPEGQGWSPMSWQILEGSNRIPITLFEATAELDAGPIYLQKHIELGGHELVEEWRVLQARATFELCLSWLDSHAEIVASARPQTGVQTHYRRRRPTDSQLDPQLSLAEQFNLLRVVDNKNYPAFFNWHGHSYTIQVGNEGSE